MYIRHASSPSTVLWAFHTIQPSSWLLCLCCQEGVERSVRWWASELPTQAHRQVCRVLGWWGPASDWQQWETASNLWPLQARRRSVSYGSLLFTELVKLYSHGDFTMFPPKIITSGRTAIWITLQVLKLEISWRRSVWKWILWIWGDRKLIRTTGMG